MIAVTAAITTAAAAKARARRRAMEAGAAAGADAAASGAMGLGKARGWHRQCENHNCGGAQDFKIDHFRLH